MDSRTRIRNLHSHRLHIKGFAGQLLQFKSPVVAATPQEFNSTEAGLHFIHKKASSDHSQADTERAGSDNYFVAEQGFPSQAERTCRFAIDTASSWGLASLGINRLQIVVKGLSSARIATTCSFMADIGTVVATTATASMVVITAKAFAPIARVARLRVVFTDRDSQLGSVAT